MLEKDITLSVIYDDLSYRTGIQNFVQVANHLDDDNLLKYGDVHASNVKLNPDVLHHQIQDDTNPEPQHIGYLYKDQLEKLYSIAIYVW